MRLQRLDAGELARLGGSSAAAAHVRSLIADGSAVEGAVREIVERVRVEGDRAVLDYTRRFDTAGSEPRALLVTPEELDEAIQQLPLELVAGLQVTIANVAQVADAGVDADVAVELPQGQRIVLRELPVGSAAVYVPGGRAPYPSTVAMGVVTARAAGVLDVAVCAPPSADGQIDATILGTCRLCGVQRVYRMGGAQAIAALAYGTETVERVDVLVGPGNLYVQEAKRLLSRVVGIDGFAGPSDLFVLLGADAGEQEIRLAALDMLAQAEHGEGSLVVAASPSATVGEQLAQTLAQLDAEHPTAGGGTFAILETADAREALAVANAFAPEHLQLIGAEAEALARLDAEHPTAGGGTFAIIETADAREALAVANAFAPEHLQLIGAEAEALASLVRSAGCLFVGAYSATAFGDYVAGSNHVLPTGGAARFASTLSARHFRRRMAQVRIAADGAGKLASAGVPIARAEGFEWHARSMEARMGEN